MRIAIPSGSLFNHCQILLAKANIAADFKPREYFADVANHPLIKEAILLRPQHIPEIINQGLADCGLCGKDCLVETGLQSVLTVLAEFNFAKIKSDQPAKLIIFGQTDTLRDDRDIIVAAEYPEIARAEFPQAKIIFSHGTTESLVRIGAAHYGLGVFESGETLIANGLKKVKELFDSPVVLISRSNNEKLQELTSILVKNQAN
ncbi:MAG: ATP phosphoribosyltransferase [Candidatus Parcubacteria bacterium]|nr:ATP phosphoribosyltransferase [Candidatus Parcubacteria bacterium]